VRWYLRYSLSLRDVEELLNERGLEADHTTVWRWVQRYAPELVAAIIAGIWVFWRFILAQEIYPNIEFTADINVIGVQGAYRILDSAKSAPPATDSRRASTR